VACHVKTGGKYFRLVVLTGLLVVSVLTACSGADSSGSSDRPSQSAEATARAAPPPEAVTLAELGVSEVPVRGAPDWMADDGATLYVKTDSGSVAVIDPAKSAEVRRLPLGARGLCQGIGAGGGAVWSCSPEASGLADDVLRVNPKSCRVLRFEVEKRGDQGHLDVTADRVWVITDAGLVGLDVRTGQADPPIDLGLPGTDLAATDDRAYVVSRGAGAVVEVDLAAQRVVAQSAVPDARAVAVSDQVWVVTGRELVAFGKERLEETARIPIEGAPCSVAARGEHVFVGSTQPLLTEVDAKTHQVSRVVTDTNSQCGDVHVAFGSIWLSANEGDVVHRIPL